MTLEMKLMEERREGRAEGRAEVLSALGISEEEFAKILEEKAKEHSAPQQSAE